MVSRSWATTAALVAVVTGASTCAGGGQEQAEAPTSTKVATFADDAPEPTEAPTQQVTPVPTPQDRAAGEPYDDWAMVRHVQVKTLGPVPKTPDVRACEAMVKKHALKELHFFRTECASRPTPKMVALHKKYPDPQGPDSYDGMTYSSRRMIVVLTHGQDQRTILRHEEGHALAFEHQSVTYGIARWMADGGDPQPYMKALYAGPYNARPGEIFAERYAQCMGGTHVNDIQVYKMTCADVKKILSARKNFWSLPDDLYPFDGRVRNADGSVTVRTDLYKDPDQRPS